MTTPTITTIAVVREHLKLPQPSGSPPVGRDDDDLQRKLDAATQLVCDYIADRHPADPDWIAEIEGWTIGSPAAPPIVVLAVLEQVGEFYRFRGDNNKTELPQERGYLSPAIENLLSRYKNRAFA